MCGGPYSEDNEYAYKDRPWMDPGLDQREADRAYRDYWDERIRQSEEGPGCNPPLTDWERINYG